MNSNEELAADHLRSLWKSTANAATSFGQSVELIKMTLHRR